MDIKDVFMYAGCIPALLWTIYESSKVPGYIQQLRNNNSECYQPHA